MKTGKPNAPKMMIPGLLPFMLASLMMSDSVYKGGGTRGANGYVGGGSPIFIPKRTKHKGIMREQRRTGRGHGKMKYKFS